MTISRIPNPWILIFCCVAFLLYPAFRLHAESPKGPLQVRNSFPPFFMFLSPLPDSPGLLQAKELRLSLALDYSSTFVHDTAGDWEVLMDMETTLADLRLEYGLADYLTLGLQVPFISMNGGFMDGFLENYHKTFGFPNYGREKRPKNKFGYQLYFQDKIWLNGRAGGFNPCDSSLSAKLKLLQAISGRPVELSLSYHVKFPLGDPDYGYGSGEFDHGIFLLSRTRLGDFPVVLYIQPGFLFLSDPHTLGAAIEVDPSWSIFCGLEYLYSEKLSLMAQINYFTSPFQAPGISQLHLGGLQLDFGFSYSFSDKSALEFAFCEDLSGSGAPDFNLHLRTSLRF